MLCMGLEECGLEWEEDGAALVGGPTGIDLIGDGVVIGGEALALAPGAHIIKSK